MPIVENINIKKILALTFPRANANHKFSIAIANTIMATIVLRIDRIKRSLGCFMFIPPIQGIIPILIQL